MKITFKPLRNKHWSFGTFYLIPTLIFEWWNRESEKENKIHIRWLSYQLSVVFSKVVSEAIDIPQEISVQDVECENIRRALNKSNSFKEAAALLGISVYSLRRKMKEYNLNIKYKA